jgi:hypothetical protein
VKPDGSSVWLREFNPLEDHNHAAQVLERIEELQLTEWFQAAVIANAATTSGVTLYEACTLSPRELMTAVRQAYEAAR